MHGHKIEAYNLQLDLNVLKDAYICIAFQLNQLFQCKQELTFTYTLSKFGKLQLNIYSVSIYYRYSCLNSLSFLDRINKTCYM